ncbi:MAG: NADH-quinone oxidoreductase subunit NuoK [Thermoguttaceae bacterium]|nr:NADH-quinone oxidoreductase subunit NuoK [Thermoguttaceae bacterium]MDW8037459.1 NADH-quinone oxidoreductase subunit NuoK [Thermoguttaceae bacterium]
MTDEALLHQYLVVGAMLFSIGLIGFFTRRNMILMFLSTEMMLQGVSLSLVGWSRFYDDFGGQMLVIFILVVAACEAAIGLALIVVLFRHTGSLDIALLQRLREANLPPWQEANPLPVPEEPSPVWPHLAPAGIRPPESPEATDFRETV